MEYGHRLRQVVKEDFDWLLDLRRATMDPHIRASGDEPLEEVHREAVLKDYDSTRIIVVRDTDVGMVKLITQPLPWHLRQIQIAPEFQGAGIGRSVLTEILDQAREALAPIVLNVLRVNPAKTLYESLGFQVVEENARAYRMEWHPRLQL